MVASRRARIEPLESQHAADSWHRAARWAPAAAAQAAPWGENGLLGSIFDADALVLELRIVCQVAWVCCSDARPRQR